MEIAIGSDHRGISMKQHLAAFLRQIEHGVFDVGTHDSNSVDYPDFAAQVGLKVASGKADRGVLICGTGLGMAIAANKCLGIRAAPVHDTTTAELSRRHNNINVLCIPADSIDENQATEILQIFLDTEFDGGRHERRIRKIDDLQRDPPNRS